MNPFVEVEHRRPRISFGRAVVNLIGHLVGSGVLFISFFAIGWGISFAIHWFDGIHKLPDEMSSFIAQFELWIAYVDAALCAIVVLAGAYRFVKDLGNMR